MTTTERYALQRQLDPMRRRIAMMIRRCKPVKITDKNAVQTMQLEMFKGEIRDQVERIQEYGFSSVPLPGGQAVAVCVDGESGHEVVVATDDRRYRPRDLKPGDMMLYTKANKCCGKEGDEPKGDEPDTEHHIYWVCDCREIRMRAKKVIIDADQDIELISRTGSILLQAKNGEVVFDTPMARGTEEVKDQVRTMQADRDLYNAHGHPDASPPPSPAQ